MDGVQATWLVRQAHPETHVIVLTAYHQDELVLQAMAAGARGYILKEATSAELIDAIRRVDRGEALLDTTALRQGLDEFRRLSTRRPGRKPHRDHHRTTRPRKHMAGSMATAGVPADGTG